MTECLGTEVFLSYMHVGQEAAVNPSYLVFLRGCNLACRFCTTAAEAASLPGQPMTVELYESITQKALAAGARTITFLGGEPMLHVQTVAPIVLSSPRPLPVVWDTNLYCDADTLVQASGAADWMIADLKFGSDQCAEQLAGCTDYIGTVHNRLREAATRLGKRLIVRHLAIPGHIACCTFPVLEWLADNLPEVELSLRLDYAYPHETELPELRRYISSSEAECVHSHAATLGIRLVAEAEPVASFQEAQPESVTSEFVLAPHGAIYVRHASPAVADLLSWNSTEGADS